MRFCSLIRKLKVFRNLKWAQGTQGRFTYKKVRGTVELRWLKLVMIVGASTTHPCVRAIPSLTIFKLGHVYFKSSFYRPKLQRACDTCHWSITLCTLDRMSKHMYLLKVNTLISLRICAGWFMHLLSSKLYRLSSCGWMFLFMCCYSLCLVVYRFL